MPELPEAETIIRGLQPLTGQRLGTVEVLYPDVVEEGPALRQGAEGSQIVQVHRRGKNVILDLVQGDGARPSLVVNLGMSGRLLLRPLGDPSPPPTHPGLRASVARLDGTPVGELVYHDPRRFGRIRLLSARAFQAWSETLGPEPLSAHFRSVDLEAGLKRSRSPIRSWLLDQRRIAGVGNIYANEALFLAGIHPETPAAEIPSERVPGLHRALKRVLRDAVAAQGTTLRDYRTAQGWEGSYGTALRVYGRENQPCPQCRTPVVRRVFGNRSAFLCPRCQPEPEVP
jgi:formamidopyrimidine-DNA glycosylase